MSSPSIYPTGKGTSFRGKPKDRRNHFHKIIPTTTTTTLIIHSSFIHSSLNTNIRDYPMSSSTLPQASYYLLYRNNHEIQQKALQTAPSAPLEKDTETKKPNESDGNDNNNHSFWQEFEWSEKERTNTQQTLSQNLINSGIVENNASGRGQYLIDKYEKEAGTNWDKFYKSHQTKFFKDRHYLEKAFPDEFGVVYGGDGSASVAEGNDFDGGDFTIVEIGCGVGNTVLPLLELIPSIRVPVPEVQLLGEGSSGSTTTLRKRRISVWGLDFSVVAVDLLQEDERYIKAQAEKRAMSAVWDITKTHPRDISTQLESTSDISLLLFCLSAVSPEKMPQAAIHVAATLKPGGTLILRDYGRYDEAQIKLGKSRGKRLSENFYVKQDATRVYYFDLEDMERLFGSDGAGLDVIEIKYIQRVYKNRSDNTERRRVWVQARFRKPLNFTSNCASSASE